MPVGMERRRETRVRYRLSAEIVHAGERQVGFLIDVSPVGAFIQISRLIPAGQEVEIRFADDGLTPQLAHARVVRSRAVPAASASVLRSGVGVEWIHAPQFARALAPFGIEVEVESEQPEPPPSASAAVAPSSLEEASASPIADFSASPAAEVAVASAGSGEIVPVERSALLEETLELGPIAVRAEVVVIDEGELGAFEELAQSLGARTLRLRWGAQAEPIVWEAPPRVVIVSARVAMAVPLGDTVLCAGAVGIAVCDSEAQTLRARLRRQGYELAVQRAAHPATLRLLLASLLFRQRERRREPRRAFGAAIGFWRGLRRIHGTLLEVSRSGASLLLTNGLILGTRLTVRVPGRQAGGRKLSLTATAVRAAPSEYGALVGLRFDKLSARKRQRLDTLIQELEASGPAAAAPVCAPALAAGARSERGERRRGVRVRGAQQALVLDASSRLVRDVLFGTDLSLGGMRIEPHPRLVRGAAFQIALQPPGGAPPVTLRAEVARDDGERGLVLRFLSPSASAQLALERLLDATAEVERTRRTHAAREDRVVLGALVEAPLTSG